MPAVRTSKKAWVASLVGGPPDPTRIGGSDISAILGRHPWMTADDVYKRMTEGAAAAMTEPMVWGVLLEPLVAASWAVCWGVTVAKGVCCVGRPAPWGRMSPDYLVASSSEKAGGPKAGDLLEVKTTSEDRYRDGWGDDPPSYVVDQVTWYLGGLQPGPSTAWVVCLVGGQRMVTKQVAYDPSRFVQLLQAGQKFMDTYFDGIPP